MSDNFELSWRKSPFRKVNTKQLCLLCLSPSKDKIEDYNDETEITEESFMFRAKLNENRAVSLACLQRHLKIGFKFAGLSRENITKLEKVEATLCIDCEKVVSRFSNLFQQWEKVNMEMDFYLERVSQIISESAKDVHRVQHYSQKMTSERETLIQLVFVDEFRKEVAIKSLRKKYNERVYLERENLTRIKTGLNFKTEENRDLESDIDQSEVALDSFQTHSPEQSDFDASSHIIAISEGASPFSNYSLPLEEKASTLESIKIKCLAVEFPKSPVGKYECPTCKKLFGQRKTARRHYKIVHLLMRYKCNICKMASYTQMKPLKKHQTTCEGPESYKPRRKIKVNPNYHTLNPATKFYHCNKCDKKSRNRHAIQAHFESVHLKIRHKCDICNLASFSKSWTLDEHKKTCRETLDQRMAKEQQRKQFQFLCKLCGKRFALQRNLSRHKSFAHDNPAGFKCDLCEKTFTQPISLKYHRDSVHFGKGFCCRFCNTKLASYKRKKSHEKSCNVKNNVKTEGTN